MSPDPIPVPLDEIESLPMLSPLAKVVPISPAQRDALCEALRIAVEGLERIGEPSCPEMRLSPVERLETARSALAAVRELVDLGGDDG